VKTGPMSEPSCIRDGDGTCKEEWRPHGVEYDDNRVEFIRVLSASSGGNQSKYRRNCVYVIMLDPSLNNRRTRPAADRARMLQSYEELEIGYECGSDK
jgi:hypothetical protein